MNLPPAGWHPDPDNADQVRYWDGEQWTENYAARYASAETAQIPALQPSSEKNLFTKKRIVLGVLVIFFGMAALGSLVDDNEKVSNSSKTQASVAVQGTRVKRSTTTTTTTTTTTSTTTTPSTTIAPATTAKARSVSTKAPVQTAAPTTAAPSSPGGGCDPNYSGCVPIDSDVDCAGGSGNGPSYVTGPVQIIGTDIYGLDGNPKNGIGCE